MRQGLLYRAVREHNVETRCPADLACKLLHISRSAYHRWASGKLSNRAAENERLAEEMERIHARGPEKGCRRIRDELEHDYGILVNDKRVLRICRVRDIKSAIRYNSHGRARSSKNPQYLAENALNRQFYADKPNDKWLTDVTEFKWYEGIVARRIDNGPMEGFWGILKRERYYGKKFTGKNYLIQMIHDYIHYYNTRRVQRNLGVLTPMEKHFLGTAA